MAGASSACVGGWSNCATVTSLLQRSLESVVVNLPVCSDSLECLPTNLKGKCLYLMCKRGLITDDNIKKVLHDKLKVLDLSECDITDAALEQVHICPQLRKIDLNSAKHNRVNITTTGVLSLAHHCPYLQIVYLRRCENVTDEAIISLSTSCKHLRELNVGGCCQLTDVSLIALGQNSKYLTCVNLSRTNVTDEGILRLVSGCCSQNLKELHIDSCKSLTDMSVEAVLSYCPQISILLFHGCPKITDESRQAIADSMQGQKRMKQVTWTIY
ncbi:protein AMN1 homolog [Liolophura sinensis]|uniref:protein AMN1 homolog n=1 Tax=Liolophura sinensis TaxID=3198878 RepID=UPI0031594315